MNNEIEPMDSEFAEEREKILLGLELAIQDISHRLEPHGGKLRAWELIKTFVKANRGDQDYTVLHISALDLKKLLDELDNL